jgi:hypothetical protein
MTTAVENEYSHIGESRGCEDHVHDLIHELSRRLDALWRLDQYAANAEGHAFVQELWRNLKYQEQENIKELKRLLVEEMPKESA